MFSKIKKIHVFIKHWKAFKNIHSHAKNTMKVWAEHGKETYNDPDIWLAKSRLVEIKKDMQAIFKKYNEEYCTACDGLCCYVIWGGFHGSELAAMDDEARKLLVSLMAKTKKAIKKCFDSSKCMYHGEEVGCKLPWELRSVLCTKYICPIFKNVIQSDDKEQGELYIKELEEGLKHLGDLINKQRMERGLNKLKW